MCFKHGEWRIVNGAIMKIQSFSREFGSIYKASVKFVGHVNEKLAEENIGFSISITLPETRSAKAPIEGISDSVKRFEISCHNVILDAALESMKRRYNTHGDLYKQISCFDPNRFQEVKTASGKIDLSKIEEAIPGIDSMELQEELVSFASNYMDLKKGLLDKEIDNDTDDEIEAEIESDEENDNKEENYIGKKGDTGDKNVTDNDTHKQSSESSDKKEKCKNCLSCAFKLLYEYNMGSSAYENLYAVYKYLLTLSITQCTCERSFSKLKIVKSRLRSTLTQNHLETLMLITVERTIANELKNDKDCIIDRVASTSKELRALLMF